MTKEYHYSLTPKGPYLRSVFSFGLSATCPLLPPHQRHDPWRLARVILFDHCGHYFDEDAVLDFCTEIIELLEPPWVLTEAEIAVWLAVQAARRPDTD